MVDDMWPKSDTDIAPKWSMSASSLFLKQRITARNSGIKVCRGGVVEGGCKKGGREELEGWV